MVRPPYPIERVQGCSGHLLPAASRSWLSAVASGRAVEPPGRAARGPDGTRPGRNPGAASRGWSARSTRGPVKNKQCSGLGQHHVGQGGETGQHATGGGMREHGDEGRSPASASISSATTVFAICIRERMPSCIRAPPDADTTTSGHASSTAAATSRPKRSPTTEPMEPPRNRKSMTPSATRRAPHGAEAGEQRLGEPGLRLGFGHSVRCRREIEEVERVGRRRSAATSSQAAADRPAAPRGRAPTGG